jgi:hypothetical protein
LAVQLYMPMSTNFTSTIKNTSSLAMTFIRRSCAAGKSVPPSFCQDIWGAGYPFAAHSNLAVRPVFTELFPGTLAKNG